MKDYTNRSLNTLNTTSFFGVELERLLKERNLSRNAFAHRIGYDPSYITRLVNGERTIKNISVLEYMLDVLRVHGYERARLMWLCGLVDTKTLPPNLSEEVFRMLSALA